MPLTVFCKAWTTWGSEDVGIDEAEELRAQVLRELGDEARLSQRLRPRLAMRATCSNSVAGKSKDHAVVWKMRNSTPARWFGPRPKGNAAKLSGEQQPHDKLTHLRSMPNKRSFQL